MSATITTGPRKSVLKGQRTRMHRMVKDYITAGWFWNMVRNKRRGDNYALHNASGKLAGFAVMGKNMPHLGGSTYLFLIGAKTGHGYGTLLLQRIIKDARARGLKYIFLEPTGEHVKMWYRKFGFQDVADDVMVLNLSKRKSPSPPAKQSASVRSASRSAPSVRHRMTLRSAARSAPRRSPLK